MRRMDWLQIFPPEMKVKDFVLFTMMVRPEIIHSAMRSAIY